MTDAMFEMPSQKGTISFTVSKDYALEQFSKSKFKKLKVA